MDAVELFKYLISETGIVVTMSISFNTFMVWLYLGEKKDRKEAWKTHNEHLVNTNAILSDVLTALEIIKDRLHK